MIRNPPGWTLGFSKRDICRFYGLPPWVIGLKFQSGDREHPERSAMHRAYRRRKR